MSLDYQSAKELLDYNPETGKLYRRGAYSRGSAPVGSPNKFGYLRVTVNHKSYYVHRLVWLLVTGKWPSQEIDHKNHLTDDNRWSNLREASRSENAANRKASKGKLKGVWRDKNSWYCGVQKNYTVTNRGPFKTKEEAHAIYCQLAKDVHKEFACAN